MSRGDLNSAEWAAVIVGLELVAAHYGRTSIYTDNQFAALLERLAPASTIERRRRENEANKISSGGEVSPQEKTRRQAEAESLVVDRWANMGGGAA